MGTMPRLAAAVALLAVLGTSGCATTGDPGDPFEGMNRGIYAFNDGLDRVALEPVSKGYTAVTPDLVRTSVTNFFENWGYLNTVLNQFLQGKFLLGLEDAGRFLVNTTIGIGGLFDVATGFGMPRNEEDFGQTLGVWGVGEGAFLMLPVLGPTTTRDLPGIAVGILTNPLTYLESDSARVALVGLRLVDARANLDAAIRLRERTALDPYVFTREAYRQRRTYLIHDGNPPLEPFDDELEEEDKR